MGLRPVVWEDDAVTALGEGMGKGERCGFSTVLTRPNTAFDPDVDLLPPRLEHGLGSICPPYTPFYA